MQNKMKTMVRSNKAQGMVEYILIIALVALAVVASVRIFGGKLTTFFSNKATAIENIDTETEKK